MAEHNKLTINKFVMLVMKGWILNFYASIFLKIVSRYILSTPHLHWQYQIIAERHTYEIYCNIRNLQACFSVINFKCVLLFRLVAETAIRELF